MKAIYQTQYGKSDVLQFGEQDLPKLKGKELRIRNHAASVNPRDWLIRAGRYQLQFLVPSFPLILGSDFAGEIVALGDDVEGFHVGDKVFGMKNPSEGLATYAEEVLAPAENVAIIPDGISYVDAAGVPLCSLTAWQALVNKAGLKNGMSVLIIGASGGVGCYAVQIARALGAVVTAVCSGKNSAMVTELGASQVVDYNQCDFLKEGNSYDIIFDTIGRHKLDVCKPVMNPGGIYVSTIPTPENLKSMMITKIKSLFSKPCKKTSVVMVKSSGDDLEKIADLIVSGRLRPIIDRVFPMQEASQAHDYSRSLRARGKIVLKIS